MWKTIDQIVLLLLLCAWFPALASKEVGDNVANPQEACDDEHEDPDFNVIDEDYKVSIWPHYDENVECNNKLDNATKAKHESPHPCAARVYVNIRFVDLQDVNIAENVVYMKMTYTEQWEDPRINVPSFLSPGCNSTQTAMNLEPIEFYRSKIWTPDFYMKGLLGTRTMKFIRTFNALRLHGNKTIENIATMNIVMMCAMNFEYYPFDTQECNVTLESFGLMYERIAIVWHPNKVQVLPAFSLEGYDVMAIPQAPSSIGYAGFRFPRIKVTLKFRRIRFKYILLIYVPSILHFLIAWLAFFLPKEVSQGRCIINCTTNLSLVSMLSVYTRNSPHGGYVKALDTWCYFSVFFQFLCTLDSMIDTRLLYAATNIKRNPTEAGTRHILALVIDPSNWLGQEVRLVHTRDEGKGFDETVRDLCRLERENRRTLVANSDSGDVTRPSHNKQGRFPPRYHRFLKMLVVYQEWSQYICLAWYLMFLFGYLILYVP